MYYLKEGVRHNVEVREGTIDYMVGKLEYRTSIGLMMTAYVDLRFTSVDEHGQRRFKKDFRDCIVEEVTVKKKVGTDKDGAYFESNDLYTTAGGVSLGPVLMPDKYKIRLFEDKECQNENDSAAGAFTYFLGCELCRQVKRRTKRKEYNFTLYVSVRNQFYL